MSGAAVNHGDGFFCLSLGVQWRRGTGGGGQLPSSSPECLLSTGLGYRTWGPTCEQSRGDSFILTGVIMSYTGSHEK